MLQAWGESALPDAPKHGCMFTVCDQAGPHVAGIANQCDWGVEKTVPSIDVYVHLMSSSATTREMTTVQARLIRSCSSSSDLTFYGSLTAVPTTSAAWYVASVSIDSIH